MSESLVPQSTGNDLTEWRAQMDLCQQLAKSGLIPRALVGKPADILVILMAGRELGIGPMLALRSINVIEGKPAISADLASALILKSAVCESFRPTESTDKKCVYEAKRKGQAAVTTSFTIEDASRAKLLGKDNWQKFPAAMLRARCALAAGRAVFPDIIAGIYEIDELQKESPTGTAILSTPPKPSSLDDIAQELEAEAPPQAPELDPSETTTRALIERIGKIENAHELTAWAKKHGPEIAALPETFRDRVSQAGKAKRGLLDDAQYQCPACDSIGFHAKSCPIAPVAKETKLLKREEFPKPRKHADGCILAADHEGFCKGKAKAERQVGEEG